MTNVLGAYGVSVEAAAPVVRALKVRPEAWIDFMMRFELGLEKPDPKRALVSAVTIAGAYITGGLIALAPYFIFAAARALAVSMGFTLLALFVFGYVKAHFTGARPIRSAATALVGGLAAGAAFGIAPLLNRLLSTRRPRMDIPPDGASLFRDTLMAHALLRSERNTRVHAVACRRPRKPGSVS